MIECGGFMDILEALGVVFALNDEGRLKVSVGPGVLAEAQEIELSQRWETIEHLVRSTVIPYGEASPAVATVAAVQLKMEAA